MFLLFLGISWVEHPLYSMSLILVMLRLLSKGRVCVNRFLSVIIFLMGLLAEVSSSLGFN